MTARNCSNETFAQAVDRIFKENENIAYMAVVDDEIKVIAHDGFLDLHPSKLEKLHIQAVMVVKMCSLWSEDFGRLNFVSAAFVDKYEILAVPLSKRLQVVAVLSHTTEENLRSLRASIITQFKSLR